MAEAMFITAAHKISSVISLSPTHHTLLPLNTRNNSLRTTSLRASCNCKASNKDLSKIYDGQPHFYKDFAAYLSRVWMESSLADKYYEKAMEIEPCNPQLLREYAEFAWDELRNANKAEEIYEHAIQEYPQDVELVGSYALFLWKAEE